MREGTLYNSAYWTGPGQFKRIAAVACDFGGSTTFISDTYTGAFSNAGYFLGIILSIPNNAYGWNMTQIVGSFGVITRQIERATAIEAEDDITYMLSGTGDIFTLNAVPMFSSTSCPLAAIVLKNNGIVNAVGEIEPIDAVNRGRSYMWKDLRPRHKSGWYA